MSFVFSSILGRVIGVLALLGVGAVVLFITGDDGGREPDRPITEEGKIEEQIDQSTEGVESAADSAAIGLQVYEAQNKLMVDGDLDRYRIDRLERSEEGDLNVFTDLRPGTASERKVARLCEKLIGGEPPLVDVTDFVLVFGKGVTHIRADECDVQFWQGAGAPAG